MHKQQGWPQAWEYCQAKPIQTLGRASQGVNWSWSQFIKSHHAQTSSGKGLPSHFWNRNIVRSILPGLRRKRTGLLLSGLKSSFQIKVNFAFRSMEYGGRLERHRIRAAWSPVSVMIWGAVTSAGVGPLCFIKSKVNAAGYQEILEHFMLPSADKLYGDADFLFQQDFSTCPQCQNHFQVLWWPWYYCAWLASQHAWPEPHMESMGYFQEKDEKQSIQQSRRAEGSIVLSSATGWLLPCHTSLMLEFVLKEPRPSIECINEHTLMNLNFSVLQILFLIDLRKYSNILRYWFLTFISCKL